MTFRQPSNTGLCPWGSQLKKVEIILHTHIANDGCLEYHDINEELNAIFVMMVTNPIPKWRKVHLRR